MAKAISISKKKLTPRQRALAEQYRDQLYEEYATGNLIPEKKAMVLDALGPDFFAPVDKREWQGPKVKAQPKRKALEKQVRRTRRATGIEQSPSFVTRDGRVLHPDGSISRVDTV
jgi:hypothetical protein